MEVILQRNWFAPSNEFFYQSVKSRPVSMPDNLEAYLPRDAKIVNPDGSTRSPGNKAKEKVEVKVVKDPDALSSLKAFDHDRAVSDAEGKLLEKANKTLSLKK